MNRSLITLILLLAISIMLKAQEEEKYISDPDPAILKRIEQWQDIKFGLLMHWGTYSQLGVTESWTLCPEDSSFCTPDTVKNYFVYRQNYENLKKSFNPTKFDPERWAKAAKDAGMKYVVFTTKHHDGFCMFDTKYTDYKVTSKDCPFNTNPKANITKEIFGAFRNEGLWVGAYFSKPDWHCPDYWWPHFPPFNRNVNYSISQYPDRWNRFVDFTHNQLMELATEYGKIDIFWFDGGWVHKTEEPTGKAPVISGYQLLKVQNQDIHMDELVSKLRKAQPEVIIVDRAVPGKNQNYLTPENQVPGKMLPYPWETCLIMGGGWSYSKDPKFLSSSQLIHTLVDIVAKGGNLLLNVGPGPDGTWYDEVYGRLQDIGNWMKINSGAIYNTRPVFPYFEGNLRFTKHKDGTVNVIYLIPDTDKSVPSEILIPKTKLQKNQIVSILGVEKSKLKWKMEGDNCRVYIPQEIAEKIHSLNAFTLRISGQSIRN